MGTLSGLGKDVRKASWPVRGDTGTLAFGVADECFLLLQECCQLLKLCGHKVDQVEVTGSFQMQRLKDGGGSTESPLFILNSVCLEP